MSARNCSLFLSLSLLVISIVMPARCLADQYADAANVFRNTEASSHFFPNSYGYAVFPTVGKGGFILAGGFGKGRVFVAEDPVGDTTLTQASIGFQIGGQAYTQIIFFEDERAFREFAEGGFEFGGQVNATMIKSSAQATASTAGTSASANGGTDAVDAVSPGYYKGMAVFIVATGGLMFEASVSGQRFSYQAIAQGLDS